MAKGPVRATTVRFAPEVYELIEREAEQAGISISQYIREATLARVAFSAGRRGEPAFLGNEVESAAESVPSLDALRERQAQLSSRRDELNEEIEALLTEANQAVRHTHQQLEASRKGPAPSQSVGVDPES